MNYEQLTFLTPAHGPKGYLPEVERSHPEHSLGHWLKRKMAGKMGEEMTRKKKEEQVPLKVT